MPSEIDILYQSRADKVAKAKALYDQHRGEWTQERENEFNALHDSADADLKKVAEIKNQSARSQASADRQAAAEAVQRQARDRVTAPGQPGQSAHHATPDSLGSFRGRPLVLPRGSEAARRAAPGYVEAFNAFLAGFPQAAGLQTDNLQDGGYLAPPQFVANLIRELDNTFWFRQLANVLPPTSAPSTTWPRRTARMTSFAWGELVNLAAPDATIKFGAYTLAPHYMAGLNEISRDLLRAAALNAEGIVQDEIRYNAGELEEQAYMYGDGVKKPFGVFIADPNGIPATRDLAGALTSADVFIDAKYSLREPYLRSKNLRWLFNRASVRTLAKLKATTNEPLWLVSVRDGQPDTFLGVPTILSEYAALPTNNGAYQAGDYAGIIGDFANYDVQDSLDLSITRHDDSYFNARNTVGYITRRKVDGNARIAEAFARVKVS